MRTVKKIFALMIIAIVVVSIVPSRNVNAASTDVVKYYGLRVDPMEDGSLKMTYHIQWEVQSSKADGTNFVKIKIPNSSAKQFSRITENIKEVSYFSQFGDDYVKVDFYKSFKKGEVIDFKFEYTQCNLFEEPDERTSDTSQKLGSTKSAFREDGVKEAASAASWNGLYVYDLVSDFGKVEVKSYEVKWKAKDVKLCSAPLKDGYFVKTGSLKAGERMSMLVGYSADAMDYKTHHVFHAGVRMCIIFLAVLIIGFISFILFKVIKGDMRNVDMRDIRVPNTFDV